MVSKQRVVFFSLSFHLLPSALRHLSGCCWIWLMRALLLLMMMLLLLINDDGDYDYDYCDAVVVVDDDIPVGASETSIRGFEARNSDCCQSLFIRRQNQRQR